MCALYQRREGHGINNTTYPIHYIIIFGEINPREGSLSSYIKAFLRSKVIVYRGRCVPVFCIRVGLVVLPVSNLKINLRRLLFGFEMYSFY